MVHCFQPAKTDARLPGARTLWRTPRGAPPLSPLVILIYGAVTLLGAGTIVIAIYVVSRFTQGYGHLKKDEVEAESHFEKVALEELGVANPIIPPPIQETAPPIPDSRLSAPDSPPPIPDSRLSTPDSRPSTPDSPADVEELARRLFALRIVTDREGKITMPIPPDGLIYRMRAGGLCGLLPRVESDAFMAHQCKRFDMVFTLTSTGEILVLQRFQTRLPELIDSPTEFR